MKKSEAKRLLEQEGSNNTCPECGMCLEVAEEVTGYCFIRCPDYDCGCFYED